MCDLTGIPENERVEYLQRVIADLLETVPDTPGLRLTNVERAMYSLLLARKSKAVSYDALSAAPVLAAKYDGLTDPKVFICKIRRKLRDAGARVSVETVWGFGYRLVDV